MRIFVVSSGIKNHKTDILKVFSQSLLENVVVFKSDRITNNTYFLYICYSVYPHRFLWHITGVGHCIVYYRRVLPQPSNK